MNWKEIGDALGGVHRTTVMRWEKGQVPMPPYLEPALKDLAARNSIEWPPPEVPNVTDLADDNATMHGAAE